MNDPLVSVLLPVYNAAPYVKEAIESIAGQTYRHLELIIIDDGSTDGSQHVIEQIQDSRIRAYHQANQGLSRTLNRAIQLARGDYLARQDADDWSLPKRLERQVHFLETHRDYGIVGTWAEIVSERKERSGTYSHPSEDHILKFELLFDNPFVHSSMMIRRAVVDCVGGYSTDHSTKPAEDYELWSRVARDFKLANIPEVLQMYRDTPGSLSKGVRNPLLDHVIKTSIGNLAWITRREVCNPTINNLAALNHGAYDKVLGKPTFEDVASILFEAADRVCDLCGIPRGALRVCSQAHCNNVQYHYEQYFRYYRGNRLGRKILRLLKR